MIVVNTETIPGFVVAGVKGLVQGNTVRAKHAGRDIAASFKNIVGGELKGYTELLTESRRQAVERMMAQAEQLGGQRRGECSIHHQRRNRRSRRTVTLTAPPWCSRRPRSCYLRLVGTPGSDHVKLRPRCYTIARLRYGRSLRHYCSPCVCRPVSGVRVFCWRLARAVAHKESRRTRGKQTVAS